VHFAALAISLLSLAIWLYLATMHGTFWRLREFDQDPVAQASAGASAPSAPPVNPPSVIAIVPARNEAATIGQTLTSLFQQNYPGEFSVTLADDHSEDRTAQIARQGAQDLKAESRIDILSAAPLPPGWTGKLWALNEGVIHARGSAATRGCAPTTSISPGPPTISRTTPNDRGTTPNYYWFTDADITHAPDTLQRLVARAEQDNLDLASLMVLLQAKTLPERALIPAFLFFFLKLYSPRRIANPQARTAGAAGGCILLRSEALHRIGGLASLRSEVIDDCALARAVKRSGGKIWMGLTRASMSLRAYSTFGEIRDMIARTAFTQLAYSPLLLLATLLAMFLTYLAPIALLFADDPTTRILAACTWLLMFVLYLPTIRFYRLSPLWAATLPLAALFYTYATVLSAARHYAGRGAKWKGRSQTPRSPSTLK
jgi:glycosyltransferase involved in cell wall biosynthesis